MGRLSLLHRLQYSRAVGWIRHYAYRALLSMPRRRQCNLCGWSGRRFLTFYHRYVMCPRCGSQVRHRLIAAALDDRSDVTHRLRIAGARILHISPEHCLALKLAPAARQYVTGDYATMDATVRLDITRLPFSDGRFDAVFACDVLEHVVDDRAALSELRRVLAPDGVAVLTVPQQDHLQATFEDPSIATDQAREAAYGQLDHVRNYGADFGARVAQAGFLVSEVDARHFTPAIVERYVLAPPVLHSAHPGWNYRSVVFARTATATALRAHSTSSGAVSRTPTGTA
jgi:SAM-dependent methyltransferase